MEKKSATSNVQLLIQEDQHESKGTDAPQGKSKTTESKKRIGLRFPNIRFTSQIFPPNPILPTDPQVPSNAAGVEAPLLSHSQNGGLSKALPFVDV